MLVNYWDAKFLVRDGMNSIVLMCYGAFIGYYGCFFTLFNRVVASYPEENTFL